MTTYQYGRYLAEIVDQGFSESEAKGTPYFYLQIKVLARLGADGQPEECPQYERTYRQYLANEIGVGVLKGDLRSLGVEISDLTRLDHGASDAITLVGKKIEVACEIDHYQGKPIERWRIPRSRNKLGTNAIRALQDQFGHLLRDGAAQGKLPPSVASNDSNVPF